MKLKQQYETNGNTNNTNLVSGFGDSCLNCCKKILAQIKSVRARIVKESSNALKAHEHLLALALNEAEALAWETTVPQLVFPTLAMEKVQALAAWNTHQEQLWSMNK